ncbi:hypothetical protein UFOVP435_53 [uncultured Caudovirales phage]|uniref:Uncharacterized protein n=1 Tax=uncultured Caudovirales phage TaxID=2100421 RepID=A0A6J5MBE2_9CAUD|nr:hypothetical protein UFOVP435_53 [uncultured Caudovirales phage]
MNESQLIALFILIALCMGIGFWAGYMCGVRSEIESQLKEKE